jgi:glyoxylase-like metal-dependent hydrolase (beta-lactamase superfamily II)
MKKVLILLLLFSIPAVIFSQNTASWYSTKEIGPKALVISDHGADNMYLVEGTDSAMLIDTGLGAADLATFVKKLTSKPLIVVNTHGHPDHAGANYQFGKVYVHPQDSAAARDCNRPESRQGVSGTMLQGNKPSEDELFIGKPLNTKLVALSDGQTFDLGGRKIQVMWTRGHTPGEICLLDIENKLLFTGDNNNSLVSLFLNNCRPLHEYLASLEKELKRINEFTLILPGHGNPMPSGFLKDQIECVRGILDKKLESKPYESFAGNAMISTYGRASVAFNPGNL